MKIILEIVNPSGIRIIINLDLYSDLIQRLIG